MIAVAFDEIKKIQSHGPQESDLAKVKTNWLLDHRKHLRENEYWLDVLQTNALYGTNPEILLNFEKRVGVISAEDIQVAARKYLSPDHYVQVVMRPEN